MHPKLEAGMSLASLYFKKDTKVLEDVHETCHQSDIQHVRAFLPVRLAKLKLSTLVCRRDRGDVILTCKFMRANTLPALFCNVGSNLRT